MDREYDIFEVFPNGDILWRACITGLNNARLKLEDMGKQSSNQFFAAHTPTKEVIGRVNHEQSKDGLG